MLRQYEHDEPRPEAREALSAQTGDWAMAREAAQRWLARLAPLLDPSVVRENAARTREQISQVRALRAEGPALGALLEQNAAEAQANETALIVTVRDALPLLDRVETDLRQQLAHLVPGDPDGIVDLNVLRARLAETAARQEIGQERAEMPLTLTLSGANWSSAGFTALFALAWLSFTTFHAIFMLRGIVRVAGLFTLFLLAFYGVFFLAGFWMARSALDAASVETLKLHGRELTVRKTLGSWVRERRVTLADAARAEIAVNYTRNGAQHAITVLSQNGTEFRFGENAPAATRKSAIEQINRYLAAQPPLSPPRL